MGAAKGAASAEEAGSEGAGAEQGGIWLRLFLPCFVIYFSLALSAVLSVTLAQDIPLLGPDTLALTGLLLLAACVPALFSAVLGRWGRALLLGIVITLFCDFLLGLEAFGLWRNRAELALLLGAVALVYFLGRRGPGVLAVASGAVLLSTLLLTPAQYDFEGRGEGALAATGDPSLPAILHIVIDAHAAPAGLPPFPELEASREALVEGLTDGGFRLVEGAFSRYSNTVDSLGNLLNFTRLQESNAYNKAGRGFYTFSGAALYEELGRRGYVFRFYQPEVIDYCDLPDIPIGACHWYPFNSPAGIPMSGLPLGERLRLLANAMLYHSYVARQVSQRLGLTDGLGAAPGDRRGLARGLLFTPGSYAAHHMVADVARDLAMQPRGNVFVLHLMTTHAPWVLGPDCRPHIPTIEAAQEREREEGLAPSIRQSEEEYRLRASLYARQVACTPAILRPLTDLLAKEPALADAVVLLHGDHGSREPRQLGETLIAGTADPQTYADFFSVLFAVRGPGVVPGLERREAALDSLLATYLKAVLGLSPASEPADDRQVHYSPEIKGKALHSTTLPPLLHR